MDRKDQEILGVVIFVVGLLLYRQVGSVRRLDPLQAARHETNPFPYYALRLLGMVLIVAGAVILFRA